MNNDIIIIPLENIDEPAAAMRTEINRDEVFELAQDIKKNGLINPITVRPKNGKYEVVAGHRRFLAHRYGGLPTIRCVVRELTDDETFAIMTSENLKRENVNPVDEAIHVQRLMQMTDNDVGKVADMTGMSRAWVADRMAIAEMPDNLKTALREEKIKIGVALALTKIKNDTDLETLLSMAIIQGASIVTVNYWVAQWEAGLFGSALVQTISDPNSPGNQRQVVMLRCNINGKQYPAEEFTSLLIWRGSMKHIDALRAAIEQGLIKDEAEPVEKEVVTA